MFHRGEGYWLLSIVLYYDAVVELYLLYCTSAIELVLKVRGLLSLEHGTRNPSKGNVAEKERLKKEKKEEKKSEI